MICVKCRPRLLAVFLSFSSVLFSEGLVINEVMSSNGSTIFDEDGDTPDWIELYNSETVEIDLGGYGITDNPAEPYKWIFPVIEVQPQNHLLIYASGKDRLEWVAHWETVIDWGDNWYYFLGNNEPPNNWNQQNFDDSGWLSGPS